MLKKLLEAIEGFIDLVLRFLSAWLFEGKHLGPGDAEFGVEVTHRQNLAAENALYWTHTFVATPRNPQDLSDQDLFDINRLNRTIVSCGKSVNLLRRCAAGILNNAVLIAILPTKNWAEAIILGFSALFLFLISSIKTLGF